MINRSQELRGWSFSELFEIFERRRGNHVWLTRKHRRFRRLRNPPRLATEIEWFTFRSCCTSRITLSLHHSPWVTRKLHLPRLHTSMHFGNPSICTLLCTLEILSVFPCVQGTWENSLQSLLISMEWSSSHFPQSLIRSPSKSRRSQTRKFQIFTTKVPELFALLIKIAITEQLIDCSILIH